MRWGWKRGNGERDEERGHAHGRFGVECAGTLAAAHRGERLVVVAVDDNVARASAIRFGLDTGACVQCVTRIPSGPVVVRCGRQEIAVGRGLSRRIRVRAANAESAA